MKAVALIIALSSLTASCKRKTDLRITFVNQTDIEFTKLKIDGVKINGLSAGETSKPHYFQSIELKSDTVLYYIDAGDGSNDYTNIFYPVYIENREKYYSGDIKVEIFEDQSDDQKLLYLKMAPGQ